MKGVMALILRMAPIQSTPADHPISQKHASPQAMDKPIVYSKVDGIEESGLAASVPENAYLSLAECAGIQILDPGLTLT
jgi:hypothetical protein